MIDEVHFGYSAARNLRDTGAILPSSRVLAKVMVRQIAEVVGREDTIIELGPGTGAITKRLLRHVLPRCRSFIAIEKNERFSQMLLDRYPDMNIIHGDARNLDSYISPKEGKSIIVSSLPLTFMRTNDVITVASKCAKVLEMTGGYMFQYTYRSQNPLRHAFCFPETLRLKRVYLNLPPATIWRYGVA